MLNKDTLRNFSNATARKAFPKDPSNGIQLNPKTDTYTTWIPPSDGYFTVSGKGNNVIAEIFSGWLCVRSTAAGNTYARATLPVNKGSKVSFAIWGQATEITVWFIPNWTT